MRLLSRLAGRGRSAIIPRALCIVAGTLLLYACSDKFVAPIKQVPNGALHAGVPGDPGAVFVCKKGGPPGTYQFHVDFSGGGNWHLPAGPDVSLTFDGTNLVCLQVANQVDPATWAPALTSTVTVNEIVPPGMHVDSIQVFNQLTSSFEVPSIFNTPTAVRQMGYNDGRWFKYFNAPNAATPSASCVSITAVQGVAITPVTMTGVGGAGGPYTFSATGLPPGLTMSAGGTISGTPTTSGTFNYVVTVTDKDGNVGTVNCSVTVSPPPQVCTDPNATNFGGPLPCVYPNDAMPGRHLHVQLPAERRSVHQVRPVPRAERQ